MTGHDFSGAPCVRQPDLWFAEEPGFTGVAKRLCRQCAHQDDCLTEALRMQPTAGVWAGYTAEELRRTAKGRRVA